MTKKKPTNVAASVHERLLHVAKARGRPFNELLEYYAMERFLYRLSRSGHRDRFVLKGALLLHLWGGQTARSTKDIDLLGRSTTGIAEIESVIRDCTEVVEDDGLVFDPFSVTGGPIRLDAKYDGVRVQVRGKLGTAQIAVQIDIGFGDAVTPEPQLEVYRPFSTNRGQSSSSTPQKQRSRRSWKPWSRSMWRTAG